MTGEPDLISLLHRADRTPLRLATELIPRGRRDDHYPHGRR